MLKIKAFIFSLLILALGVNALALSYSHAAQTPEGCSRKFLDGTDGLKAYLSMLFENRQISDEDLGLFLNGLQNGKLINPISEQQASSNEVLLVHQEGLEKEYFQNTEIQIDQKELLSWVSKILQEKEKDQKDRKETQIETEIPSRKLQFHKIPKGKFMMGGKKNIPVELTYDFYLSDTHITQAQWVEVMGENPSGFKEGDQSITIQVNGKSIRLQPDHPVEQVTWWSVLEFANRLSEKHGLRPVYDLSQIKFKEGTKAEDGSWRVVDEKAAAEALKIFSPNSNSYESEGYRLATEEEYEYVLTNLGKSKGKYVFGDSEKELKDSAWFENNSEQKPHSVAEKKAFKIDGNEFFDLHGNVSSWVWNWNGDLKESINPQGPSRGSGRVYRGGSWFYSAQTLRSSFRLNLSPSVRWHDLGFRLVRTAEIK